MKTWVRHSLNLGALTAGALLASGAAAQAGPVMTTGDNIGLLNGTQALIPVQVPVNVCGNAVAVAGVANGECDGGATALNPEWGFEQFQASAQSSEATMTSTGNVGVLNGTQALVPVQVPVNICGNAVAVAGVAGAACDGGATAGPDQPDHNPDPGPGYGYGEGAWTEAGANASSSGTDTMVSSGNVGLLNGTQVLAPIQVPVDVCGNAVSVLGVANAACVGGATASR